MKFTLAALTGLVAAVAAADLPAAFTLVADGGNTVVTDGQYLYYGGNVTGKAVAILKSGSNGMVSYTAANGVPTAFQNLFLVPDEVSAVELTVPHSGATTKGATTNNFGVNDQGYFTNNGDAYFAVDGYGENPQKQVYWYGAHNAEYMAANLYVKECKGC